MAKILITGATGFIGSHIAALFSQENIPIKCLVRESSNTALLQQLKVELNYGDINDLKSIESVLDDIDFVIHTAGKSSDWGGYKDFYKNNVEGTLNILKACKLHNIADVIITGSVSSYGEENSQMSKNEESPYNSHYPHFLDKILPSAMNYYRDTKAILTRESTKFAKANGLNLTIVEPTWVFGEREFNTGFYEYLKSVQDGMKWAPGSRKNKFHVIYAGDLARGYLLAYQKKMNGVNRIIIGNSKAVELNKIHTLLCESANLKPPKLIPKFLIYPAGFFFELIATIFHMNKPPIITRSRVNMMYDNIEFSCEKAKKVLGFQAEYLLRDGIYKTVKWYIKKGFL